MDNDELRWREALLLIILFLIFFPAFIFFLDILISRSNIGEAWVFLCAYISLAVINLIFKEMKFLNWIFGKYNDPFLIPSLRTSFFSLIFCAPLLYKILPDSFLDWNFDGYFIPLYSISAVVACTTQAIISVIGYRLSKARDYKSGKYLKHMTPKELEEVDMSQFK